MKLHRIATLALLAGIAASPAYGQADRYGDDPYGDPPRDQGQYDAYWHPADAYDRRADDGYDRGGDAVDDVGFFYDELSPYGEWVRHPYYGWVWFPRHVRADWRPYSLGRWAGSDYGWTWVSYEPFGWATYHYGRWAWDRQVGWLWVPGTDWAPAWVAWQHGHGYVGWAPLPPQVGFQTGIGIRLGGFDISLGIAARDYAFVEERRFLDSRLDGYIVPQVRNLRIIHDTRNVTSYDVVDGRVINHGVPVERIEQVTGRRTPRLRVAMADDRRGAGEQRGVITIYRPRQRNLDTVRIARRNNAGLQQGVAPPARSEAPSPTPWSEAPAPVGQDAVGVPIAVAPHTRPAPRDRDERQFAREQRELTASQDRERRALEQIQRREMAQPPAKADAKEAARRHAAELAAQEEQGQRAERQLRTRQQIERRAAAAAAAAKPHRQAKPPAEPGKPDEGEEKDGSQ